MPAAVHTGYEPAGADATPVEPFAMITGRIGMQKLPLGVLQPAPLPACRILGCPSFSRVCVQPRHAMNLFVDTLNLGFPLLCDACVVVCEEIPCRHRIGISLHCSQNKAIELPTKQDLMITSKVLGAAKSFYNRCKSQTSPPSAASTPGGMRGMEGCLQVTTFQSRADTVCLQCIQLSRILYENLLKSRIVIGQSCNTGRSLTTRCIFTLFSKHLRPSRESLRRQQTGYMQAKDHRFCAPRESSGETQGIS